MFDMNNRGFLPGDEASISELFKESFGREMSFAEWRWRYLDNPFGGSIIELMFDREKLVGHYAVIRLPLTIEGEAIQAAFSMTTMTHPDYGGRGIFTELAERVFERCIQEGIRVVFGFPNINSYHGFTRKLGWQGKGNVPGWIRGRFSEDIHALPEYYLETITCFGLEFDRLLDKRNIEKGFYVPRTSEFLNWRYLKKPGNEYQVIALRSSNGTLGGFLVLKLFLGRDFREGHIIDALFICDRDVARSAIRFGMSLLSRQGAERLSCWDLDAGSLKGILRAEGFQPRKWETNFGLKLLGNSQNYVNIDNIKDIFLAMGDSDVF